MENLSDIPKCKCGKPAIIRHYKKSNMKPTSMGVCRDCLVLRIKNRKPRKGNPFKGKAKFIKNKIAFIPLAETNYQVTLDFTNNIEIFNKLKEKAKAELRTIENQILYALRTV